eukprot:jgi/Mesvir1/14661/Mv05329-RA.1
METPTHCRACGEDCAADERKGLCKPCRKADAKRFRASKEGYFRNHVHLLHKANRRSGRRRVAITASDLADVWDKQSSLCAVSKMKMIHEPDSLSTGLCATVDLIDPKGDYTKENVRLVCRRVKRMKGSDDIDSFLSWCARIGRENPADDAASEPDPDAIPDVDVGVDVDCVGSTVHTSWADVEEDDMEGV